MASLVLLLASFAYCVTTAFNVTAYSHSKQERKCAVYCDDEPVLGISRLVALVLLTLTLTLTLTLILTLTLTLSLTLTLTLALTPTLHPNPNATS